MAGNNSFKICLIILCLFVFTQKGKTQEFGISGLVYPSLAYNLVFEPGMNGGGVAIFFNRQKFKKLNREPIWVLLV